ncbi:MAG TPA: thioesterase family protein [Longimicrobiales bacterium]|nr:thioesterase family protein [Longimicrobiales bacterium]
MEPLSDYPITVTIPVAWGDMDAFCHVNNTVFFRWFETARIAFLGAIGFTAGGESGEVGPILGSTSCRFRRPVQFPDTVVVGVRITALEADRFVHAYRVVSHALGEVAADGEGVVVAYDYGKRRKTDIPEKVRRAIESLNEAEAG